MFIARRSDGSTVNALTDSIDKTENVYCPGCSGSLRFRSSKRVRPHFAHKERYNCHYLEENEGPEHLGFKALLFDWGRHHSQMDMEVPFPQIGQVADLLMEDRLALEVQCSPLSKERLRERTLGYRKLGIAVVWLLGKRLFLGTRLSDLQRQLLRFSLYAGFYCWELDLAAQVLRLRYLLHEDLHGRIWGKMRTFPLGEGRLKDILAWPEKREAMGSLVVEMDQNIVELVRRKLYRKDPFWMKRQAEAYVRGENLLTYRLEDFYPQLRPLACEEGFCQVGSDLEAYQRAFVGHYRREGAKAVQEIHAPMWYLEREG